MLEDSRHVLLQAQVDYWKDMITFNSERVADSELRTMRRHLDLAEKELTAYWVPRLLLSA